MLCLTAFVSMMQAAKVNPRTCDWSDAEEDQEGEAEEDDEELPSARRSFALRNRCRPCLHACGQHTWT